MNVTLVGIASASSFVILLDQVDNLGKYLKRGYTYRILLDFSHTVKAAPHECVIRTSQP